MAFLRIPLGEVEDGEPGYEQNGPHPALLYPPSYFKTAGTAGPAEGEESSVAGLSPASTYVVSRHASPRQRDTCSEQEDKAARRRQNEALRLGSQQQAMGHSCSNAALLPPCFTHCTPAILTSDLLQVERGLQSKLVQLEAEGHRLADQLATAEDTLREERASHTRDRENLIAQHRAEVEQVMGDRSEVEERWRRECEEWRERVGRAEERERERIEELRIAEEKLACVTQEKTDVCGQLEEERSGHTEELASLQLQLRAATEQNESTQGELEVARQRMDELEAYLGGELPDVGVTWREERTALLDRVSEVEGGRQRAERETELMAVRLAAISEILTLQETVIMPGKGGDGAVEKARDTEAASPLRLEGRVEEGKGLKNLLTLWREKVFTLLVQGRLAQMQHQTELQETQARVSALAAEVGEVQRERDLVTHTLTDTTAQLQLLTSQNEELESCVQRAEEGRAASQSAAEGLSESLQLVLSGVDERWTRLKSCLNGCLSRLANYQQRVGVATGRVSALRAVVGSQMMLGGVKITRDIPLIGDDVIAGRNDVTTQTEPSEKSQELSKLPADVLVEEVLSLMRDRDTLSCQLSQSTLSLQQLTASASERQETLEQTCASLTADNVGLREELEGVRGELEAARTELEEHRGRETQLQSAQASLQARIDEAVMEERRRGRELLNEAQALLEVAKREQMKTALQLQRSQRKVEEERAGAVEAAEVARQALEGELQRCRDRLRAVQVERNLLLTTLRQEGIKVPPRRPPLKLLLQTPAVSIAQQQTAPLETQQHISPTGNGTHEPIAKDLCPSARAVDHSLTLSLSNSPPLPFPSSRECADSHTLRICAAVDGGEDGVSEVQETGIMKGTSPPHHTNDRQYSSEEDIQNVLKELQLLSTALLDMNTTKE